MEAETILNRISEIIQEYESGSFKTAENLRELLRELSANYYYLTKINVDAYNKWNNNIYNRGDESVASARVKADKEVPELRMTRKIMEATDHVIWSMRSEISIIKNEK